MAIALSPGVTVIEKDFTSIVPQISSSACGFAGAFAWGPILDPLTISSENELVERYGKPNNSNFDSFFTAANFLSYSNNLLLSRIDTKGAKNATVSQLATVSAGDFVVGVTYEIVTHTTTEFTSVGASSNEIGTIFVATGDGAGNGSDTARPVFKIKNAQHYLDVFSNGSNGVGPVAAKFAGELGNSLKVAIADSATYSTWAYKNQFASAPSTSAWSVANGNSSSHDELHILVIDEEGAWTGVPGTILEKFAFVSKASGAKTENGTNNYYKDVLNSRSLYVWWTDHPTGATNWGSELTNTISYASLVNPVSASLSYGANDYAADIGDYEDAYTLFGDADQYELAFLAAGKASPVLAEYIIGIAESRKDVVVFISPEDATTGEPLIGSGSAIADKIIAYRDELPSTSFAFLDTGYKYQYDRYNDKYRWVPLNGDIAGLAARTDETNDPWFSPGGFNRGQIKNVVKLAFNPNKTQRDLIYPKGINPVVSFPGQGVVLYGDKTLLAKPSAFDRIGVRRLFIVLEKSISEAAKFQLFEFNDTFTRTQFKNMIEPFLRDVQGRRGINAFQVVCDTTNNTGAVIERNEFVADIFVKPNYSINYITLNFVATRQSVSFSTVGA